MLSDLKVGILRFQAPSPSLAQHYCCVLLCAGPAMANGLTGTSANGFLAVMCSRSWSGQWTILTTRRRRRRRRRPSPDATGCGSRPARRLLVLLGNALTDQAHSSNARWVNVAAPHGSQSRCTGRGLYNHFGSKHAAACHNSVCS